MKKKLKIWLIIIGILLVAGVVFWGVKSGRFAGLADVINNTVGVEITTKDNQGKLLGGVLIRGYVYMTSCVNAPCNPGWQPHWEEHSNLNGWTGTSGDTLGKYSITVSEVSSTSESVTSVNPCTPQVGYSKLKFKAEVASLTFTPLESAEIPVDTFCSKLNQVIFTASGSPSSGLGNITGTVTGPADDIIANASVTLTLDDVEVNQTNTDADGVYFFASLLPGSNYEVKAQALGFQDGKSGQFNLPADKTVTKDIQLNKAPPNKFDLLISLRAVGSLGFIKDANVEVWSENDPSIVAGTKWSTKTQSQAINETLYGPDINAVIKNLNTPTYGAAHGNYFVYHVSITAADYYAPLEITFKAPDELKYDSATQYLSYTISQTLYAIPKFTLKGRVIDKLTHLPVYEALISVVNKTDGKKYEGKTDEFGYYEITGIPKDDQAYTITVSADKYKNYQEDFLANTLTPDVVNKNFILEPNVCCRCLGL